MMGIRTTKIIRDLWTSKARSLLTVLAVAAGVAAFGLMLTGRIVLDRNLADEYAGTNPAHSTLVVTPFESAMVDKVKSVPGVKAVEARHQIQAKIEIAPQQWAQLEVDGIPDFNNLQIERLALQVPGVSQVESWGIVDARHVYQDDRLSGSFTLIAVPPTTAMTRPSIAAGRWLTPHESGMLFVNADTHARIPDMVVGNQIRLRVGGDERSWTVAGVGSRELVPVGFIDYADFERITNVASYTNRLVVRTAQNSFDFQSRVEQGLLRHFNNEKIAIANSATTALRKQSPGQLDILIVLLMSMTIIIAIVGGLGLAITMGLNVMERTREIGVLRSLGATGGVVRRTVIGEGLVIGLFSWAIGTVLSIPLGLWLGDSLGMSLLARPLDYIFSVAALLIWLALIVVIAIVASVIPAQHAAQLTIRDTLAYAG